jgi:hypothetical protein
MKLIKEVNYKYEVKHVVYSDHWNVFLTWRLTPPMLSSVLKLYFK